MDLVSKTRFNKAPTLNAPRTRFDLSHSILTTCNTGDFVPVFVEPVYPGETHSLKTSSLVRLETSLHQTMDNAYFEIAYFFVPDRLIWEDFEKFLGANDDAWVQTQEFSIPCINLSLGNAAGEVKPQSLLNYLGIPAGQYGHGINANSTHLQVSEMPLRATFQIYNDWYRDENYDSIIYYSKQSLDHSLGIAELFNGVYFKPAEETLKVNRFKDVFSTALPAPQKGNDVTLSLGQFAPIVRDSAADNSKDFDAIIGSTATVFNGGNFTIPSAGTSPITGTYNFKATSGSNGKDVVINPQNLKADLSQATAVTINQLRLAIASQAIAERDARGGTRMKEKIFSTWHVDTPDLQLDRAEFLGGKRIPVSMMEVLQTSETGTTVLGTDAGHSKTVDYSDGFIKSFTQYGWIIGVCYFRTARSYSQGIDRKLRDRNKFDLYDPMLDNIGELGVHKSELFALDTSTNAKVAIADSIFGYQEAWYWLKERLNRFSGYFQPGINGTMDSWHYGDNYSDYPSASPSWLKEDSSNVDRTIAVSSDISYQWKVNLHFEYYATRQMKKYSIPNTFGF